MTTSTLYLREDAIRRGAQSAKLSALAAEQARQPLQMLLRGLHNDREEMLSRIENHFQCVMASACIEQLGLLAALAKKPEQVKSLDLLPGAGLALRALFSREWQLISTQKRDQLANQLFGYLQIVATDSEPASAISAFANLAETSIKLELSHAAGQSVYRDETLLIAPERCLPGMKPELYVCIPHRRWYIWSFMPLPGMNAIPPLSSIKAARKVISEWRGKPLSGDLCGDGSDRICRLLGLDVKGYSAFLNPQKKGFA